MSRDPLAALIKAAAVADEVVLTVGRDERAQAWPHALLAALRVAGWDITPVQVNPAPQLVNEPPTEHLIPPWWRGREWSGLTVCGLPARDGVFTDDPLQATCNVCLANNGLPEAGIEEHGTLVKHPTDPDIADRLASIIWGDTEWVQCSDKECWNHRYGPKRPHAHPKDVAR